MQKSAPPTTGSSTPIRVLLVDNHQLAIWGLQKIFEPAECGIQVVGTAGTATDALRLARQIRPDVVVLALDLGKASLDLIPRLLKNQTLRIVAMAGASDTKVSDWAVLSGARGLLRREDSVDAIVKSIRRVHAGELWLDRAATGRIFSKLSHNDAPDPEAAKIAALTARERKIVAMLGRMGSARHRKIANLLNMSEHTLRNHLSHIYAKLELGGHFELYLYAQRHGLAEPVSA